MRVNALWKGTAQRSQREVFECVVLPSCQLYRTSAITLPFQAAPIKMDANLEFIYYAMYSTAC